MIQLPRPWLLALLGMITCTPPEPVGQFGPYHRSNKYLRLGSGDSIPVYRVKLWQFADGSPPALQVEYECPALVADTEAVIRFARRVWPLFRPYVDSARVGEAILTATNLHRRGWVWFGTTAFESYGTVAARQADGLWYLKGHAEPLPEPDRSGTPKIFEPSGIALPFKTDYPIPR